MFYRLDVNITELRQWLGFLGLRTVVRGWGSGEFRGSFAENLTA
jgi:hypothetical protein